MCIGYTVNTSTQPISDISCKVPAQDVPSPAASFQHNHLHSSLRASHQPISELLLHIHTDLSCASTSNRAFTHHYRAQNEPRA